MPEFPHIGLIGPARSGKDTVAALLVGRYQYTRLAFADRIRQAALAVDPLIPLNATNRVRLSSLVEHQGWDRSKTEFPEVRRVLQDLGQAIRDLDPEFWLRPLVANVRVATEWNLPVVVSDVRHPEEAEWLREAGAVIVRVDRPGADAGTNTGHVSETALSGITPEYVLLNTGSLADLAREVAALITELRSDT